MSQYLAIDLGAGSGRVMLGTLQDGKLDLAELNRFSNDPIPEGNTLRWQVPQLLSSIETGFAKAAAQGARPRSVSCDSWGVDYGLLDKTGTLLELPYIYRDIRTDGMMEKLFAKVPRRTVFERTGLQFMQLNTLFQITAASEQSPDLLERADRLLLMGDLFNHCFGGDPVDEQSLASTTQFYDVRKGTWAEDLVQAAGMPTRLLAPIVPSGTRTGHLASGVCQRTGLGSEVGVVATCSHDTGCAVAAVPGQGDDWAYLSCGTWSLMGVELPAPLINDAVLEANFTNEVGYGSTVRFLKNITGLWIIQECRRAWEQAGQPMDYQTLMTLAQQARPFAALINPDAPIFQTPGNMPSKIGEYLKSTGQQAPLDPGSLVRIAFESLALKYRATLETLEKLTGRTIRTLHLVGGGARDQLLSQFTANAIGRTALSGPVEATATGNLLIQAIVAGELSSIAEAREVVRRSVKLVEYLPTDGPAWDAAFQRFIALP
jgi:rhamnulokinase